MTIGRTIARSMIHCRTGSSETVCAHHDRPGWHSLPHRQLRNQPSAAKPASVVFTAAQAAQKKTARPPMYRDEFTAAQAAQKLYGKIMSSRTVFTAAQAAQKRISMPIWMRAAFTAAQAAQKNDAGR